MWPSFKPRLSLTTATLGALFLLSHPQALRASAPQPPTPPSNPASQPGAAIYRERCASCHGDHGQGVKDKYNDTLTGTRSVAGLARLIEKTMPEGEEGTCTGPDAQAVAAYIFDAFYSPAAQAKIRPARETLSRLTIAQYRHSVTDLLGHFRPGLDRPSTPERGLKVIYNGFCIPSPEEIAARDAEKDPKKREELQKQMKRPEKLERIEPGLHIHLGAQSPDPQRMLASEFQIRAAGSIVPPETGPYEFIVRSENGIRLYVNGKEPLLDAWVSSGPEVREEKRSVFLLGGRTYRLVLELLKFKDKSASVELWWKPPHGILEPLPASRLLPREVPSHFVPATSLPADDRSDGYERGTTLSKDWDQATTAIALEVAEHVASDLDALAGTKPNAPDRPEKLRAFAQRFVELAFRRPLTPEQRTRLIDSPFSKANSPVSAVHRVVLYALKSPHFLYPEASQLGEEDPFATASRLALTLWDSIPDAPLWKAAAEGKLQSDQDLQREVSRMLNDPRARSKVDQFLDVWLETERAESATKDARAFPEFDDALKADLRTSLKLFLEEVIWSERSDYRELLQANHLWLNERLAKLYGAPITGSEFQRHVWSSGERAGVLTHPYLLSGLAYSRTSSPIHRGVFLCRNILGVNLKSPSIAASFEDAKLDPSLTMREKVTALTQSASCSGCHALINPLGFTLENFDTLGRWRSTENQKPIHTDVDYEAEEGGSAHFSNARDIAQHAVSSPFAHDAFIRHLFHHLVKQPPMAFGPNTVADLRKSFRDHQFSVRQLIAQIALLKARKPILASAPIAATQTAEAASRHPEAAR
jgi:mono/diheme cytochrome c family protein